MLSAWKLGTSKADQWLVPMMTGHVTGHWNDLSLDSLLWTQRMGSQ